jgi:hypothetical protein
MDVKKVSVRRPVEKRVFLTRLFFMFILLRNQEKDPLQKSFINKINRWLIVYTKFKSTSLNLDMFILTKYSCMDIWIEWKAEEMKMKTTQVTPHVAMSMTS